MAIDWSLSQVHLNLVRLRAPWGRGWRFFEARLRREEEPRKQLLEAEAAG
jgi:hypothetical protein